MLFKKRKPFKVSTNGFLTKILKRFLISLCNGGVSENSLVTTMIARAFTSTGVKIQIPGFAIKRSGPPFGRGVVSI